MAPRGDRGHRPVGPRRAGRGAGQRLGRATPLLAIAFYAGTSTMRVRSFLAACLVGRTVRFVMLALVPDLF